MSHSKRPDIGVVGAGIIGLSCALRLSEAGYKVSVLARDLPGDDTTTWASPWAGAVVLPSPSKDSRDIAMQIASLRYYWALAHQDPTSGVQTVRAYEYWDQAVHDQGDEWYETKFPHFRRLRKEELPPGTVGGNTYVAISVNPDTYLSWIKHRLESVHEVKFIRATVQSLRDAKQILGTETLINATGLGAKDLANDEKVVGIRGQTMFVHCPQDPKDPTRVLDKEVRIRRGDEYTYVLPRALSGGVIIGGIEQEGSMDTAISVDLQQDILKRVNVMTNGWFSNLKLSDVRRNIAGIRPGREGGYRVENTGDIIHAYGFAGAGYRYSVGAAEVVVDLLRGLGSGTPKL